MNAIPVLITKESIEEGWFCEECPHNFQIGEIAIALSTTENSDCGHICMDCAKNRLYFQTIEEKQEEIVIFETKLKELKKT